MTVKTGWPLTKVVFTPEMIEAGERELVFDCNPDEFDIVRNTLLAALDTGGYCVEKASETSQAE